MNRSAKIDALNALDINKDVRRVINFYRDYAQANPNAPWASRDQLQEATKMLTQSASGRTSDAEKLGVIYKTGRRRGRQDCLRFEPDPLKWAGHASDYRNTKRHRQAKGLLNEFEAEMCPELRKLLHAFSRQNSIA